MLRPHFAQGNSAIRALFSLTLTLALVASAGCGTDETGTDAGTVGPEDTGGGGGDISEDTGGTDAVGADTGAADAGGECVADKDCTGKAKDTCHAFVCDQGACVEKQKAAGGACDDDKVCTSDDKCDAAGECKGTANCADKDECNEGVCANDGTCTQKEVSAALQKPCNDGNACTKNDVCGFGTCGGDQFDVQTECDDDNPCTTEGCDPKKEGGCTNTPKQKDDPCTDEDACTSDDKCDDKGTCLPGKKVTCTGTDPCSEYSCDKTKGCIETPYQNGVTCDDNDKCTEKDECNGGKCKGSLVPEAVPPNGCVLVTCTPETGAIKNSASPDGTSCSDGDACTVSDVCTKGICSGKPAVCNDGNPCTADTCDKKSGKCGSEAIKDGTDCDDGNKCTTKDICLKGVCGGENYTTSKQCDDKNPCTNDGCSPQSGCFHVPKDGSFCDDGNLCTELDKCATGKCIGSKTECNDNKPCTNDTCDDKTGKCLHTPFTGPCDDGNKCTSDDVCQNAKCDGKSVVCNDDNTCTQDICDTVSGCKYIPLPGGSKCDDGVGCTQNDQCDLGKCVGTNSCVKCQSDLECAKFDDGNPCNGVARCTDSKLGKVCDIDQKSVVVCDPYSDPSCGANICDPKNGKCSVVKKQKGVPCTSGNKCKSDTVCSEDGKCEGATKDCDDSEVCTVDSCDPTVGCKHAPKKDGDSCDDGNVCTSGDTCKTGTCQSPVNNCKCTKDADCTKWDDGNMCNGVFSCNNGLCSIDPTSLVTCDPTKESCTDNLCDQKTGKCAVTPVKDGKVCDDGSKCTIQEVCTGGKCKSSANLACDDGNKCTINVCNPPTGCESGNIGDNGPCDDGNACTSSDKCLKGTCAGKATECDDDNPCTIDLCDKKSGKCTALLDNKLKCDDGEPCTENDKCVDGVCKAEALKCDDGNPCTVDGCDGKGGCLNKLELNKDCDDKNACTALDRCDIQGKCVGKAKDCDDGSACTEDSCVNGACVIKAAVGKTCDDGNKCTENDACTAKGSCEASLVECDDGNVCTKVAGPCSPVNGCTIVPDDGKNCSDGDACTYLDKCKTGACNGTKINCNDNNVCTIDSCEPKTGCVNKQNTCDDDNDCTFDKCDKVKGCLHSDLDGLQPCDDGDACTTSGACNKGKCETKLKDCGDDNVCTIDKCNQATEDTKGGCVNLPVENTATKCDDDDPCTANFCDGKGKCGSTAKDCNDDNVCTIDACVKNKGCQYTDKKDGTTCDDGDVCSADSGCQGGFCIGLDKKLCTTCKDSNDCKIVDNNNLCDGKFNCVKKKETDTLGYCIEDKTPVACDTTNDTACVKNVCVTTTGQCSVQQLVNGSKCDDGQPCTAGDACTNGECKAEGPVDCSKTADTCNEAACIEDAAAQNGYSCVPLPRPGTITCDADGDPCTTNDTCADGKCKAGKKVDCSGVAGECELAACVKGSDGGFTCKITPAKDGAPCEDDQLCTANDKCKAGKCQPGTDPYDCKGDVNSVCATGVCDATNNGGKGGCLAKPKNEGGDCNADDNGCTVNDKCSQGVCVPGVPPDCNKQTAACTFGACKSTSATGFECIAAPVNESKPCEADNNGCTIGDKCVSGKCAPGKLRDCSSLDGNQGCLVGACEPLSSSSSKCVSKPAASGNPCDADSNGCTQNDTCNGKGACQPGTAVNCLKETNGCGQGVCKSVGTTKFECSTDAKPKGTKCDADGDGCTVDDTCDGNGKCEPGKAPDCTKDDKGQCIVGACKNTGSGSYLCEATPKKFGETCDADKNGCTVKDQCELGFCNPGSLETCKDLQSACAKAACESSGSSTYKCKVTPEESYPPLKEETECDPTAKPGAKGACATGYKCVKPDANATVSVCQPTATVTCADGDKCKEEAVCVGGECKGQKDKDCDDKDACTLDSCSAGTCAHQKVDGCGKCLTEGFEGTELTNMLLAASSPAIKLATVQGGALAGQAALSVTWDGTADKEATDDVTDLTGEVLIRRMYLQPDAAQTLAFGYKLTAGTADCLRLLVNGEKAWEACGAQAGGLKDNYKDNTIDLTKYAGQPVDLTLQMAIEYTKKSKGELRIDELALIGKCGPGCLGERIEVPMVEEKLAPKELAIPQPWVLAADAKNFLSWQVNDKEGKSGSASLRAAWSGGSPDGKSYAATITVPGVTVLTDSKLHFALRATTLGESGCNGDVFEVLVNGASAYKACDKVAKWTVVTVDLKPYASKTVDIVFRAAAGKTKAAAGLVELDDVAVSGSCSYTCYSNDFNGGLGDMKNVAAAGNGPKWAYATDQSVSKPGSGFVQLTTQSPIGGMAVLEAEMGGAAGLRVPVMGATVQAQINAFLNPAKGVCEQLPDGTGENFLDAPLHVGLNVGAIEGPGTVKMFNTFMAPSISVCEVFSGFGKTAKAVPDWTRGLVVRPVAIAVRTKNVKEMKAYLDDVKVICK